jgi:hydroxymethylbilane synthase
MELIVGTRGSRLSLLQKEIVTRKLEAIRRDLTIKTKIIKTAGDRHGTQPLLSIKQKGLFEKEIDRMVVKGDIDFAVHSLKDVPTDLSSKTIIAAVPKRDSPHDILISNGNLRLKSIAHGSSVGTSSPRRMAQLYHLRPDLSVEPIRGNVETRVRKLDEGLYNAIILAEAGLKRLGMEERVTERLSLKEFTPSAGQGALALVTRKDNNDLIKILQHVNDPLSMAEAHAERAFMKKIGGGCKVPLGVVAQTHGRNMTLRGAVLSPDGKTKIYVCRSGSVARPIELGIRVAEEMLKLGADELSNRWKNL